jgi:hypothetical protein
LGSAFSLETFDASNGAGKHVFGGFEIRLVEGLFGSPDVELRLFEIFSFASDPGVGVDAGVFGGIHFAVSDNDFLDAGGEVEVEDLAPGESGAKEHRGVEAVLSEEFAVVGANGHVIDEHIASEGVESDSADVVDGSVIKDVFVEGGPVDFFLFDEDPLVMGEGRLTFVDDSEVAEDLVQERVQERFRRLGVGDGIFKVFLGPLERSHAILEGERGKRIRQVGKHGTGLGRGLGPRFGVFKGLDANFPKGDGAGFVGKPDLVG